MFNQAIAAIPEKDRVYIDESGINECLQRKMARAKAGQKVYGAVSGRHFARESFIAARRESKIFAPFCYTGTCNTDLFNLWLKRFLIPELKPGQVVIMDNASFHKSQKTVDMIKEAGCELLYLPPYSPDLNPIEIFWANFKKMVHSVIHQFTTLAQAIDFSFLKYTNQEK